MHSFAVDSPLTGIGQRVTLSPEESAHAARVLRLRVGETVRLLDGEKICTAELQSVSERGCEACVASFLPTPEAPLHSILLQGLPKADKLELIAQKATELGVWALWPVAMARCVAKADKPEQAEKKRERLSRIALEAAKQSGRAHAPLVAPVRSLRETLDEIGTDDALFVAWEEEHALPFSRAVLEFIEKRGRPGRVLVLIGPEGGIAPEEYQLLCEKGAVSVTLGPRILRTETAGLCALSVLGAVLGEM